jgi:hypothetical protein
VWKQWANFHQGLGATLVKLFSTKLIEPFYPGPHQMISGSYKPNRAASRVGFGFPSGATLESPNGEIIDLGVVRIIVPKRGFLGSVEIPSVQKSLSSVLTLLVHAACCLVEF